MAAMNKKIDDTLLILLTLFIALVALPMGSNRPVFWAFESAFIFFIFGIFCLNNLRTGKNFRYDWRRWKVGFFIIFVYFLSLMCLVSLDYAFHDGFIEGAARVFGLGLLRNFSFLLFFLLVLNLTVNKKRALWVTRAIIAIGLFYSLYALAAEKYPQILLYEKKFYEGYVTGPFINRNSFATFLGLALITTLAYSIRQVGRLSRFRRTEKNIFGPDRLSQRVLVLALCLPMVAALLLTGSRMGVLSTLIAAVVIVIFRLAKGTGQSKGSSLEQRFLVWGVFLVLTGALVFFIFMSGGSLIDRLVSTDTSKDGRWPLFRAVVEMIKHSPYVGYGLDNFEFAFRRFQTPDNNIELVWDFAHNTYLSLWSELGLLVGSMPMIITVLALYKLLYRNRRSLVDDFQIHSAIGVITILMLHSLMDFSFEISANNFLLLAIVSVGLSSTVSEKK